MVAAAGFVVFLRSLEHPFVYDDLPAVRDNEIVQGQRPWLDVLTQPYWPPAVSPDPIYRPVTTATLRLDAIISGLDATGYHVTNAILHALVSVLVALLASTLVRAKRAWWPPSVAGLLFAMHPVHVEAVSLVVGRSELLAALFMLLTAYLHHRHLNRADGPTIRHHVMLAVLVLLGCLSKEHAVFTVVIIATQDWLHRAEQGDRAIRPELQRLAKSHWLGVFGALAIFFLARWLVFGWKMKIPLKIIVDTLNPLDTATTTEKLLTPFALLTHSIRLMIMPTGHSPNWGAGSFALADTWMRWDVMVGLAVLTALLILVFTSLRRRIPSALSAMALLVLLAIPCHFLPVANWFFGERWLYAPSAFLVLILVGWVSRWPRLLLVGAVLVLPLMAHQTWQYQACFSSNEQLLACVLEDHPNDYFALAGTCQGYAVDGRIAEVEDHVLRLVEHHPDKGDAWCFLTVLLAEKGEYERAGASLNKCALMGGVLRGPGGLEEASERIRAWQKSGEDAVTDPSSH